jgi:acyl-CoA hydrolase
MSSFQGLLTSSTAHNMAALEKWNKMTNHSLTVNSEVFAKGKATSQVKYAALSIMTFVGAAGLAPVQSAPNPEQAPLPEIKGSVAQYLLTPRGDVDGLIPTDGTEVSFPHHTSTQIVFAIHLRDAVTIRGVKTGLGPAVTALAVTNDATGRKSRQDLATRTTTVAR